MELSKNQKILIGILHFLPIIGFISYFIFFFVFFIGNIENLDGHKNEAATREILSGFLGAFLIIMISILLVIAVKVFDIIHLVKSNKGDTGNKVLLWVLLFVFAGTIAEIIYFFLEILPNKKQEIREIKE